MSRSTHKTKSVNISLRKDLLEEYSLIKTDDGSLSQLMNILLENHLEASVKAQEKNYGQRPTTQSKTTK